MLPKKFLPIIIAVACAVLALVFINMFLQQQQQETAARLALSQKDAATVVVAQQDISAGTVITEAMVKEETKSKSTLQPQAAGFVEKVIGKIALAPFSKGEQILLNKVSMPGKQEINLAQKIPSGKRAMTVSVDNIAALGGLIKPGDRVDVIGSVRIPVKTADGKVTSKMTMMPLYQDVMVLAVGQELGGQPASTTKKKTAASSSLITLAFTPKEASIVAFIQENGKIRLSLRSQGDAQVQSIPPADWDTVLKTVMPQFYQQQQVKPKEPEKPKKVVEIYHGLNKKEEKPLE
ncbi:MAG: Flp pilus assembly protein CpaB [Candidatus Omnitrophica bacterium]|nr:Flp pilus assembly protein CpaB [Candidatus Omnitrophota bacterium]MBU1869548.1 Flp pilus assembly protein CpaB [Candidatus Omnitrophota bacterium]